MIKFYLLSILFICTMSQAQLAYTSFEEAAVFSIDYTDTGDATIAHDLINNTGEPLVDYTFVNQEMGFNARYEPYNNPGDGLTDGDLVGVTDSPPTSGTPFPEGQQGYEISDVDGNFILEFDPVIAISPTISVDYYISETGYEGDGTSNTSGSDRLRIFIKDLGDNTEYDLLNTTGNDINDLGIEGSWNTVSLSIENSPNINVQLIIEARTNSGSEAFFFDNISFEQLLGDRKFESDYFAMYPNPNDKGYVNITSKTDGIKEVIVFDILGQQVINTRLTSERLDISALSGGIYIVEIEQGQVKTTKKLVIN
ncbi:MAG: hypothetical protein ACI9M9_000771 [Flavobacteriaceae bacterium]|jgi:hypothetical protein